MSYRRMTVSSVRTVSPGGAGGTPAGSDPVTATTFFFGVSAFGEGTFHGGGTPMRFGSGRFGVSAFGAEPVIGGRFGLTAFRDWRFGA